MTFSGEAVCLCTHANNHSRVMSIPELSSPCVTVSATRADKEGKANNSKGTYYLWVSSFGSRKHITVPCTGSLRTMHNRKHISFYCVPAR